MWLTGILLIGVAIFAVLEIVGLIKDIAKRRRNKTAARETKADDLKGE